MPRASVPHPHPVPPPASRLLGAQALRDRARQALGRLSACRLCPRSCGVDRLADGRGACRVGRLAAVASVCAHHGEEDPLRGWSGSGTVFFAGCNLGCVFCQNHDISHGWVPETVGAQLDARQLADAMLGLQARGCHNINLVTPSHVVAQILEALALAVEDGLHLPIVYNTGGYDAPDSLALLDGVVDVYMPDFKLWSSTHARRLLDAPDYPAVARAAIARMHRQVGDLALDAAGLARRGVLVRHLVMPAMPEETRSILRWIASTLGPDTYVNLMDQYRPSGAVGGGRHAEIDRPLDRAEFRDALFAAREAGIRRLEGFGEA